MSDWLPLDGPLAGWRRGVGPRLVFVHGFTQTASSWKPIAAELAQAGHECVVVDVPGHGASSGVEIGLAQAADALIEMCGHAVYIGYSLGGRLCLHAAVQHGDAVRGLALVGASPGLAGESERAARRLADERLADHILDVGVDSFLDEWLSRPLFAGLTLDAAARADRLGNTAQGLAGSLRMSGTGAQESLWDRLSELKMPVLAIAGEHDERFTLIARDIAAMVTNGQAVEIAGAGHAAHLQQPEVVTELLARWVRDVT